MKETPICYIGAGLTSNSYFVDGAYVVTQQIDKNNWMATYPGFVGGGTTEHSALSDLYCKVIAKANQIDNIALMVAKRDKL